MLLKAVAVFVMIAIAETLHGIWRIRFLNRRLGDRRARQVGLLTGTLLILAIAWLTIPWMGPQSVTHCLAIGLVWAALMTAFELLIGRLAFRMTWRKILRDFNPREGGYMGFALLFLTVIPLLAALARGIV